MFCEFEKSLDFSFQSSHPLSGDYKSLSIILGGCEVQVRNVLKCNRNGITLNNAH